MQRMHVSFTFNNGPTRSYTIPVWAFTLGAFTVPVLVIGAIRTSPRIMGAALSAGTVAAVSGWALAEKEPPTRVKEEE
jgi:hypothetical protein